MRKIKRRYIFQKSFIVIMAILVLGVSHYLAFRNGREIKKYEGGFFDAKLINEMPAVIKSYEKSTGTKAFGAAVKQINSSKASIAVFKAFPKAGHNDGLRIYLLDFKTKEIQEMDDMKEIDNLKRS